MSAQPKRAKRERRRPLTQEQIEERFTAPEGFERSLAKILKAGPDPAHGTDEREADK